MGLESPQEEPPDNRLKGRSIRVDDALWLRAQAAAQWRGERNLSAVIRKCLVTYINDTDRRKRNSGRGAQ